jgi:hypothetical protein
LAPVLKVADQLLANARFNSDQNPVQDRLTGGFQDTAWNQAEKLWLADFDRQMRMAAQSMSIADEL